MIAAISTSPVPIPHCATPFFGPAVESSPRVPYPDTAREQGLGKMTVYVVVSLDPAGNSISAAVQTSSGNMAIDQTARLVALNSRFNPEVVQCEPVRSLYLQAVVFDPTLAAPYPPSWTVGAANSHRLVLEPLASQAGSGEQNVSLALSASGNTVLDFRYACPQGTSANDSLVSVSGAIKWGRPAQYHGFGGGENTQVLYGAGAISVHIVTPCQWKISTFTDPDIPDLSGTPR